MEKGGFLMKNREQAHTQSYRVEGMHCAACSGAVERVLNRFEEIEQASVNLVMNTVSITYTKRILQPGQLQLKKPALHCWMRRKKPM